MEQFGGKERLLVIEKARVRPYDERFAARYNLPGQWYAPLLFLRETSTGEAFSIMGSVALLTSPLSLANFLENWRRVGIPIPDYEVISLLSDRDFDDFMLRLEDQKKSAIVDPMVTSEKVTRFISGIPVMSIDQAGRLDQQLASE